MKTALVLGATGLVGNTLTQKLLDDSRYSKVKIFVRRKPKIQHAKLETNIVNFDNVDEWKSMLSGDELFSCMGTTIKDAGTKANQYKVDFEYQFSAAKAASENGVSSYVLVSSAGAKKESSNFYLRIKGELEEKICELAFTNIIVFRPSLLLGKREKFRPGEKIASYIFPFITTIIPFVKKYRPINADTVAEAMINKANSLNDKISIYSLDQIFTAANSTLNKLR